MLRGHGSDPAFELEGRRQQLIAAMFAFVIAGIVVWMSYRGLFARNLVAPVDRVYVATIKAGTSSAVAWSLVTWAIQARSSNSWAARSASLAFCSRPDC